MSCKARIVNNQSGQAMIEMVLVLIVLVGVILGGLYQLNDAFRKFSDSYFGDYLACILETGEIPAMGGDSTGECNQEFQEFDLAKGRTRAGGGASDSSSSTDEGTENAGDGSSSKYSGDGPQTGGAVIAQSKINRSGGFGGRGPKRFKMPSGSGGEGDDDQEGGGVSGSGVTQLDSYSGSDRVVRIRLRSGDKNRRGSADDEDSNKEKKTKVSSVEQTAAEKAGPRLLKVERRAPSSANAPDIEDFGFGSWLRYLIIAAIIIAIIIFIGGQALQVSKSMD